MQLAHGHVSVNNETRIRAQVCLTPESVFLKTRFCASQSQGWMGCSAGFPRQVLSAECGRLIQRQPKEARATSNILARLNQRLEKGKSNLGGCRRKQNSGKENVSCGEKGAGVYLKGSREPRRISFKEGADLISILGKSLLLQPRLG